MTALKATLAVIGAIVVGIIMFLVSQALWFGGTAVNSAHGVISKTLDPNHVIFQYEHFHDLCHNVLAFNQQIGTAQATLDADSKQTGNDPFGQQMGIVSRDRTNLQALQNERETAAQQYNSDSHKLNDSIFKSHNLPYSIDPPNYVTSCEYVPGGN